MSASHHPILALVADRSRVDRLRAAFGNRLHEIDSQRRLIEVSRIAGVELVVVSPRDRSGCSLTTTVAAIRASRQSAPVYVYADRTAESLRELMVLTRAGARGVIVRDVDDDASSLRRLLERGSLVHVVETVTLAVQHLVPARQLPLLLLCLEHISEPLSANVFARRLGVSRRTLSAWARKAGAKGVRSLTSKCRVLTAIELIRDSGRPVEYVAHLLHFASSAHLHNTIKRYTGLAPRDAAVHDVERWCQLLFDAANTSTPIRGKSGQVWPPGKTSAPPAEWLISPNDATLHPGQDVILRSIH